MDGSGPQHQGFDESEVAMEAPPLVRFDERRMHVRAYNYWAALLNDRSLPSIEDLNPADIEDFGSHSVLIDFTDGIDNPAIAFLGSALMRECGIDEKIGRIREVPPRTLLSRLTDHYLQIIANQAPIGFEAEFTNQRGAEILYRGILMPFSSNDTTIDFVYGVINWKEVASVALTDDIQRAMDELAIGLAVPVADVAVWEDGPSSDDFGSASDGDAAVLALLESQIVPTGVDGAADVYLSDTLCQSLADAQGAAADAISSEGRTRQALYRAIGLAHAFALIAQAQPVDYAALLEDADIKAQPRSPLTALVKLVFGTGYDKTRLSEFAVAIEYGLTEGLEPGTLTERLTRYDGGLKSYVRDARAAKRGTAKAKHDRIAVARAHFHTSAAIAFDSVATDAEGLAVLVVRRLADGGFAALGGLAADDRRVGPILQAVASGV